MLKLMVAGSELTEDEISKLDLSFTPWAMGSWLKRATSTKLIPWTEQYNFKTQFDKVRDDLSLENLAKLKQAWATFGALSDKELEVIWNAASALRKGQSSDMFIDELNKIQESFIREFDWVDPREYSAFYWERKIALQAALNADISSQAYTNYMNSNTNTQDNDISDMIK